ncbi:MAG: hypothetical protein DCC71_23780, partial [Proteobacteria bacterium]
MDLADLVHAVRRVTGAPRRLRLLRSPALHFAAIGALLFAAGRDGGAPAGVARAPIAVSAAQVEALVARHERAAGRPLSGDEVRALVEAEIEEEVLYREGVAHGLDRDDDGVEWRLVEKMTFLSDHDAGDRPELLEQAVGLGLADGDPVVRRIVVEKMRLALRAAGAREAPSDAELAAYLERHRDRFAQPGRVVFSHVLLARDRPPAALARDAAALAAA